MSQEGPEPVLEDRVWQAEQQLQMKDQQLMETQLELETVRLGLTLLSADTSVAVGLKDQESCLDWL